MSTQSAWEGAATAWAEHHDATMPEPLLQRFVAQAARMGKEIERLRAENAALRRVIHEGNRTQHKVDL